MAVPKRRLSRSNTRHRRAAWRAVAEELVPLTLDGETHRVPRRLLRAIERGYVAPARRR